MLRKLITTSTVVAASFLISSAAFAGACDTDSCTQTVKTLYVNDTGAIYVALNVTTGPTGDTRTLNCSLTSNIYFTIVPSSTPNFNAMYATLLAAAHSGHQVNVRAADGSTGCTVIYVSESF